jgi:Na+/proline symporter
MPSAKPNRLQAAIVVFLLLAWISLLVIVALAPEIYDRTLQLPSGASRPGELLFVIALSVFIFVLVVGVLRRWRGCFGCC